MTTTTGTKWSLNCDSCGTRYEWNPTPEELNFYHYDNEVDAGTCPACGRGDLRPGR